MKNFLFHFTPLIFVILANTGLQTLLPVDFLLRVNFMIPFFLSLLMSLYLSLNTQIHTRRELITQESVMLLFLAMTLFTESISVHNYPSLYVYVVLGLLCICLLLLFESFTQYVNFDVVSGLNKLFLFVLLLIILYSVVQTWGTYYAWFYWYVFSFYLAKVSYMIRRKGNDGFILHFDFLTKNSLIIWVFGVLINSICQFWYLHIFGATLWVWLTGLFLLALMISFLVIVQSGKFKDKISKIRQILSE